MRITKIALAACVLTSIFVLTGCSKRTTTSTTGTSSATATVQGVGQTLDNLSATVSATSSASAGASASATTAVANALFDTSAVDQSFQKNYQAALQSAQSAFANAAKFCATKIEFAEPTSVLFSDQYFYFTSPQDNLKDWYWVVYFDRLNNSKIKRFFAAKRDLDDIACSTISGTPTNFSTALNTTLNTYKDKIPLTTSILKSVVTLEPTAWKIDIWNRDGQLGFSKEVAL